LADVVASVTYHRLGNVAACRIINRYRAVTLTEPTEFAELVRTDLPANLADEFTTAITACRPSTAS
jgi:hypothetical protein